MIEVDKDHKYENTDELLADLLRTLHRRIYSLEYHENKFDTYTQKICFNLISTYEKVIDERLDEE